MKIIILLFAYLITHWKYQLVCATEIFRIWHISQHTLRSSCQVCVSVRVWAQRRSRGKITNICLKQHCCIFFFLIQHCCITRNRHGKKSTKYMWTDGLIYRKDFTLMGLNLQPSGNASWESNCAMLVQKWLKGRFPGLSLSPCTGQVWITFNSICSDLSYFLRANTYMQFFPWG